MGLGRIFGVRVQVHPLFLLLLLVGVAMGQGYVIAILLLSLVGHEMAHLAMARFYGMQVDRVLFHPFGGVATITGAPADGAVEGLVALAGPFHNLILATAASLLEHMNPALGPRLLPLVQWNGTMGLFNLLPFLPLDGGRVLRAFLSRRLPWREATARASRVSRLGAVLLLAASPFVGRAGLAPLGTALMGGFLFLAAGREERQGVLGGWRYLLAKEGRLGKERILEARLLVVAEDVSLLQVVGRFLPHQYHVVLVVDGQQRVRGQVTEGEILSALPRIGANAPIRCLLPSG